MSEEVQADLDAVTGTVVKLLRASPEQPARLRVSLWQSGLESRGAARSACFSALVGSRFVGAQPAVPLQ